MVILSSRVFRVGLWWYVCAFLMGYVAWQYGSGKSPRYFNEEPLPDVPGMGPIGKTFFGREISLTPFAVPAFLSSNEQLSGPDHAGLQAKQEDIDRMEEELRAKEIEMDRLARQLEERVYKEEQERLRYENELEIQAAHIKRLEGEAEVRRKESEAKDAQLEEELKRTKQKADKLAKEAQGQVEELERQLKEKKEREDTRSAVKKENSKEDKKAPPKSVDPKLRLRGGDSGPLMSAISIAQAVEDMVKGVGEPQSQHGTVVVGLNTCVDLVLSSRMLLQSFGLNGRDSSGCGAIDSMEDFEGCFSHYFADSAAGERTIRNETLWRLLSERATSYKEAQYFTGGNAALMATRFQQSPHHKGKVVLFGAAGPRLRGLIGEGVIIPQNAQINYDEYHIILEYKKGDVLNGKTAIRGNRFIITRDMTNAEMTMLEVLRDSLGTHKPGLIVLSGLHMLEALESDSLKRDRMDDFKKFLDVIPKSTPTHLELASMGDEGLILYMFENVLASADSIGLNEQELLSLSKVGGGPVKSYPVPDRPDVASVASILEWLLNYFPVDSRISRIHFHTLSYHIVAEKASRPWLDSGRSVLAGSVAATRYACDSEKIMPESVHMASRTPFSVTINAASSFEISSFKAVYEWKSECEKVNLYMSHVLVCKKPSKTVGLGDAISATGLMYTFKK